EFESIKKEIGKAPDSLGRLLLQGTHPTGTYSYTDAPLVSLSGDRRDVTLTVSVNWKGGFSENAYQTTYALTFNKKEGVTNLRVLRDTALIKIDPQFLRATESSLKDIFSGSR